MEQINLSRIIENRDNVEENLKKYLNENPNLNEIDINPITNINTFLINLPKVLPLLKGMKRIKILDQNINATQINELVKILPTKIGEYDEDYNPKIIKYNKEKLEKIFPYKSGIDIERLLLTDIGLYSVSRKRDTAQTTKIIMKYITNPKEIIITEANGGIGGDTLSFAKYFKKVNVVEINKTHCMVIDNNIRVYGLEKNVNLIHTNYLNVMYLLEQNVIFFDPPWGGPNYMKETKLHLYIGGIDIEEIINSLFKHKKEILIALKIPHNFNITSFKQNVKNKYMKIYKFYKYDLIILK